MRALAKLPTVSLRKDERYTHRTTLQLTISKQTNARSSSTSARTQPVNETKGIKASIFPSKSTNLITKLKTTTASASTTSTNPQNHQPQPHPQ